ncbi:hypothetical protein ACFWPQ_01800 [Streptomyces sp. NPDC058464]|uniref:hypothetical protein n=1 Tax=Streptomyces sp. NPDC058464 TaxID=3346511 RepID=UPI0036545E89
MSQHTDDTLGRYLDQQPGMREALLHDPVQHYQAQFMRRTLAAADRAMADEDVPDAVRRRVVNRIVWGEPEGRVDVHAQMDRQRKAMAKSMMPSAEALAALLADGAGSVRPDEENQ